MTFTIKPHPEIVDQDFLYFYKKLEDRTIIDRILSELDVRNDNKNYFMELSNKIKNFISKEKEKIQISKAANFFEDKPMFNYKEIHTYIILIGIPFVEASKQDKFKQYLTSKSVLTDFAKSVKEIYFPYKDEDKTALEKCAMAIIQFNSIDEAKLVKNEIDGKFIMKNNQGLAFTIEEYLQLFSTPDQRVAQLPLSNEWELKSLEEQYLVRSGSKIQLNSFHYFRKETLPLGQENNIKSTSLLEWSPNGTYLAINTGVNVEFYLGSNNLEKAFEIPDNSQKFNISPNEKFITTFAGLGNSNIISDPAYLRDLITRQNVFIWSLISKELLKSIKIGHDESFSNMKWSDDSQFLARLKGDVLIVYESPDFKMLHDQVVNKRHPLTDKVTSYDWFPRRNCILTIYEKRKHKQIDTTLNFYEVPSRKQCLFSIPFSNIQVISYQFHPNNKTILVLLKTVNVPQWSIRIIDFNFSDFTHKSKSFDILNPVVKSNNPDELMTEKDIDFTDVEVKWMDNGNEILIIAKKRLLIPNYSRIEKRYITSDEGHSISLLFYSYSAKEIKAVPWNEEKVKKNLKYNQILCSPSGKNLIVYNKLPDSKNTYGEALLFAVDGGSLHLITKMSFGDKFSKISFDQSGRFFTVEMSRMNLGNTVSGGFKIFYISGELIIETKDESLNEVMNALNNYFRFYGVLVISLLRIFMTRCLQSKQATMILLLINLIQKIWNS